MSFWDRLGIGIASALAATAGLFLFGWTWETLVGKRRRAREAAARDPYWGAFAHAYGDASDLPALFARMTPDRRDPIWGELWQRLCHQGMARTTAGVAAVPVLVEYAASLAPNDRIEPLILAGTIAADASRVVVRADVQERFDGAMGMFAALSMESIPTAGDEADFASLISALAAAEGVGLLAREFVAFLENEIQLDCIKCGDPIIVSTETEPWTFDGAVGESTIIRERAEHSMDLSRYADLASESGQVRYASWIRSLEQLVRCTNCNASFSIADALDESI
ncbi:MAG TPA: hypothetical protein VLV78_13930 [Thermoanaerobaculia bacterium]|nr:hypothetical protein [Thermoanaerobaculia bacterium]